jgi:hypothetical protein
VKQIRRGNKESVASAFTIRNLVPIDSDFAIVTRADDRKYKITASERQTPSPVSGRKYHFDMVADTFMQLPWLLQRLMNEALAKRGQYESACEFFELRKGPHFSHNYVMGNSFAEVCQFPIGRRATKLKSRRAAIID